MTVTVTSTVMVLVLVLMMMLMVTVTVTVTAEVNKLIMNKHSSVNIYLTVTDGLKFHTINTGMLKNNRLNFSLLFISILVLMSNSNKLAVVLF